MFFYARMCLCLILAVVFFLTVRTVSNNNNHLQQPYAYELISSGTTTLDVLTSLIRCEDVKLEKKLTQRGQFLVFENYVVAEKQFRCDETITLTAPGDYRFLDNVVPLVERWNGPVSIALYAPGTDFATTLECIAYLRACTTPLVKELVTFHLFFEYQHMPFNNESSLINVYKDTFDCSLKPPYEVLTDSQMYKEAHGLFYPINVARNIAKTTAQTHFVFPSDIELYPTRNFIPKFLTFIRAHPENLNRDLKKVFVLPIFEMQANLQVPENKTHLREMFKKKQAILFHQNVCSPCHKIPRQDEWLEAAETPSLDVFQVTKRQGKHNIWEPFFVCTQREPLWDERLNWEGQGNKMCQAYTMCIQDYDFAVLDNAFLIHKPGVKKNKVQVMKHMKEVLKNNQILLGIQKEMQNVYGTNKHCKIHSCTEKFSRFSI